ncbi:MAG: class II glutamine amidotransferase [bacterium]|nr:class II glutamine amidotransferase [bacterium]
MCRLYGFRANQDTKVECSLIYAQNALMAQSKRDARGGSHTDGWGIGFFNDSKPIVERRVTAAYESAHFATTVENVYSRAVIAHVRNATVGELALENTHPFAYGRWVFVHNGTVRPFDRLEAEMEPEIAPRLAALRRGTTDSECAFYWLLSRFEKAGVDIEAVGSEAAGSKPGDADELALLLGESVLELERRSAAGGRSRPAMLNFLLTDGNVLLASRWQRDLHLLERDGVRDCEICGIPHVHQEGEARYRATVVASEPISQEDWREVPDGSVVAVGAGLEARIHPLRR